MVYLQDIRLTNFKCFEDTSSLEFGKLTLLTGANSTGKSSLMYGMLGVLQSKKFPLEFSPNGIYVQMGNFMEMVFKHDSTSKIGLSFTLVDSETDEQLKIESQWMSNQAGNPMISFNECTGSYYYFKQKVTKDGELLVDVDIDPSKNRQRKKFEELLEYANSHLAPKDSIIEVLKYATEKIHLENLVVSDLSSGNMEKKYPLFFAMREATSFIERYNAKVNYISSYRQPAQRIYTEEPVTSGKIATSGEGFINELLTWKDNSHDKFDEFVEGIKSIGLLSEVEPSRLGSGQFKIGVKVHEDDALANLSDVGFGISQTMPIIIADVELGKGSTLYVSQPEVHLHPRAQAKFGDYLVKQMLKGKRYVIESHSEYLMNRLRLSVVRGDIQEEDIKVYYMSQGEGKTTIHTVKFKKNGQIEGAPHDFFDTYMIDVMDIAMSAQ